MLKPSEKITEKAEFPGMCFQCGGRILVGDIIVRDVVNNTPIARHAECDMDLSIGDRSKD